MPKKENNMPNIPVTSNYRGNAAYVCMSFLVLFTSVGAGLIYVPAGLIVFGLASGFVGYLLGAN